MKSSSSSGANGQKELDYRFKKTLWGFRDNRLAVSFEYEWHDRGVMALDCSVISPGLVQVGDPVAVKG